MHDSSLLGWLLYSDVLFVEWFYHFLIVLPAVLDKFCTSAATFGVVLLVSFLQLAGSRMSVSTQSASVAVLDSASMQDRPMILGSPLV